MNPTKKETVFHSDKICRLCLSRKRAMLPIFYEDGSPLPMASRILTYIGIEVSFRQMYNIWQEPPLGNEPAFSHVANFVLRVS
jgi:hypothetical protein